MFLVVNSAGTRSDEPAPGVDYLITPYSQCVVAACAAHSLPFVPFSQLCFVIISDSDFNEWNRISRQETSNPRFNVTALLEPRRSLGETQILSENKVLLIPRRSLGETQTGRQLV